MNILLITADDLNWNSVGCYGCSTPDASPRIDGLAASGMRFERAHVTIAVCQPSRGAIMTGRYPHRSGQEGFHYLPVPCPTLPATLRDAGYALGILGKCRHSSPDPDFEWDLWEDMDDLDRGRDAELYHQHALNFMSGAVREKQSFFLMANAHDPHRPFYGSDQEARNWPDQPTPLPSRVYEPDEVEIPGFLPELPEVRRELAEYHSSVRRCDDTVGRLLDALEASGAATNTAVIFLSDNGMAFPFSKTNCYLHSTKTPLLVRVPGMTTPGCIDRKHYVSGIDLMPTILDLCGVDCPSGTDGDSFKPLLTGKPQPGRTRVFTQFHETAGQMRYPMRCLQNGRYGYILNPWSDGVRAFQNESQSGRTFKAMQDAVAASPEIAARVELFVHRVAEELYDMEADPDCLHNLIDDPSHSGALTSLRAELRQWMVATDDPALAWVDSNQDAAAREAYMAAEESRGHTLNTTGGRGPRGPRVRPRE